MGICCGLLEISDDLFFEVHLGRVVFDLIGSPTGANVGTGLLRFLAGDGELDLIRKLFKGRSISACGGLNEALENAERSPNSLFVFKTICKGVLKLWAK